MIGLALCDHERRIASPLLSLKRQNMLKTAEQIFMLYDEHACAGLVLGLPLNMDGSSGPRAQAARALGRNLLAYRDVPLAFQDERLTTQAAERVLLQADMSRKRRAKIIDKMAATYLLQSVLDQLKMRI